MNFKYSNQHIDKNLASADAKKIATGMQGLINKKTGRITERESGLHSFRHRTSGESVPV